MPTRKLEWTMKIHTVYTPDAPPFSDVSSFSAIIYTLLLPSHSHPHSETTTYIYVRFLYNLTMDAQVAFSLTVAFSYFFCGAQAATITFINKCPYTVWPATRANDQRLQLSTTGFELANGASNTVNLTSPWSGWFSARTGCATNSDKFTCATADCGSGEVGCHGAGGVPPPTLIELTVETNNRRD